MKKGLLVLISAGFVFCLASCMGMAPEPVDETKKAAVMEKAKNYMSDSKVNLRPSSIKRKKLQKGQWVAELTKNKKGSMDLVLTIKKVIDVQGSRVTLETESYSAEGGCVPSVNQTVFLNYPVEGKLVYSAEEAQKDMDSVSLVSSKSRQGDGEIVEMPAELMMISGKMASSFIKNNVSINPPQTAACESDYLKSGKCYKFKTKISILGFSKEADVEANSNIPLTGQFRLESDDMLVETIGFGYSGAKPSF